MNGISVPDNANSSSSGGAVNAASRLDDAAAVAAAAAVAVADNFDVRVSLTRMGNFRASRMDDMISVPGGGDAGGGGGVLAPRQGKEDVVTMAARKNTEAISNGMKKNAELATKANGIPSGDDTNGDIELSPSQSSLDGPRRSVEDASVDTTIESVAKPAACSDTLATDDATTTTPEKATSTEVKLRLTPEENRLFKLLTDAAEAYESGKLTVNPNPTEQSVSARGGFVKQEPTEDKSWLKPPPEVEKIEIRVAGGWVRDKLLNQHSCDVDVALDCMMGVQFARIVQSYMALQQEEEEKNGVQDVVSAVDGGEGQGSCCGEAAAKDDTAKPKKCKNAKQAKNQKKKSKQPKIGVIGANPSQSKHLETATMNIHAIDIDFVNLRAEEVYLPGSRIPTSDTRMFGTPLEDALRRDFTINSLFYNVRSGRIEDWTGRGLSDLSVHRKIVTPVDPHVTFHDDPLRVLRAVRFAVRLDFELDETIMEAARSNRVHHSLHVKVSRERVGKELEGMLSGKHARPAVALNMIADLHLAGSVFCFPGSFPGDVDANKPGDGEEEGGPVVSGNILGVEYNCGLGSGGADAEKLASRQRARGWEESSALLALLPELTEGHAGERVLMQSPPPTVNNTRLMHLCVFILPFHYLSFLDKKGTKTISVTAHMMKEALKFPQRDVQAVSKILSNVDEMAAILSEIRSQLLQREAQEEGEAPIEITPPCRLRAGLLLRSLKEHWVTCLLTAAAWENRSHQRLDDGDLDSFRAMAASATSAASATRVSVEQPSRVLYRAIVSDLDLDECWRVPPHLDGKKMIKELTLPKGPIVGEYLADQTQWMLLHPEGTKEDCTEHLRARKREREEEERLAAEKKEREEANLVVAKGEGCSAQQIAEGVNGAEQLSKETRVEK